MSLRYTTNFNSLQTRRFLDGTNRDIRGVSQKLASGKRINSSKDDAAGMAISEMLRAKISSTSQAIRNATDAISMVQLAEGSLGEVTNVLIRLRELAMQTSNDVYNDINRANIDAEFQEMKDQIQKVAITTNYNGRYLLNGSGVKLDMQIGLKNNAYLDRFTLEPEILDTTIGKLGLGPVNIKTKVDAQSALEPLDKAIVHIATVRSTLGAKANRLTSILQSLRVKREAMHNSNSIISDADMVTEVSNLNLKNLVKNVNIQTLNMANNTPNAYAKLVER